MPTYNRVEYIEKALLSLLSQTFSNFEIIIVNDGSKVEYQKQLEKLLSLSSKISLVNLLVNKGSANARNIGLSLSKGDYIFFMDDDDFISPNMFEIAIKEFENVNLGAVVFSYENILNSKLNINYPVAFFDYRKIGEYLEEKPFQTILKCCPPINSIIIRKEIIREMRFIEDLRVGEDWFFWLQLAFNGCKFKFSRQALAYYRRHHQSVTNSQTYFFSNLTYFFEKLQKTNMLSNRHDRFFVQAKLLFTRLKIKDPKLITNFFTLLFYPEFLIKYFTVYCITKLSL